MEFLRDISTAKRLERIKLFIANNRRKPVATFQQLFEYVRSEMQKRADQTVKSSAPVSDDPAT
jgi:hypothetical protein